MAHVRKGHTVSAPQWWKHLRPFGKRQFWKRQRKAWRKQMHADACMRLQD